MYIYPGATRNDLISRRLYEYEREFQSEVGFIGVVASSFQTTF